MTDQTQPAGGKKAVILGATGAVGKAVLAELLASSAYSQVHAFVRRSFKDASGHGDNAKLVEHIIDYDKLVPAGEGATSADDADAAGQADKLRSVGAEAVYITLGTTRAAAGSAKAFERIDRDYVLAAAKAALQQDAGTRAQQRVVYCSSSGSNSKAPFLYMKSKGLTEEGLASAGYGDCILFRPGFLAQANRDKPRYAEHVFGMLMTNVVSRFSDGAEIRIPLLAKAMVMAGTRGSAGLTSIGVGSPPSDTFKRSGENGCKVTVVSNAEAKRAASEASLST